jgi:hypothetical protein
LERAVANPVESGAREEVTGGSIVDRAGVGEGRGHEAGRQDGGGQTCVSLAGGSIEGHLHLPSWLMVRRRRRDVFSRPTKRVTMRFTVWWVVRRMTHDRTSDRKETSGSRGDEPPVVKRRL